MNKQGTALIALAGFGLGIFVDKGIAAYGSEHAGDAIAPASATAMLPAGHPRVGERDLGDVVATTMQMSIATKSRASMPGASPGPSSVAGSPDLLARADELRRQRKFKE